MRDAAINVPEAAEVAAVEEEAAVVAVLRRPLRLPRVLPPQVLPETAPGSAPAAAWVAARSIA
jgi:hypothetical protein